MKIPSYVDCPHGRWYRVESQSERTPVRWKLCGVVALDRLYPGYAVSAVCEATRERFRNHTGHSNPYLVSRLKTFAELMLTKVK